MKRASWVWLHRYVGLVMAGFLVLTGLTGSVLAFQSELDAWLNPRLFRVEQAGVGPLSPSQLIGQAERDNPGLEAYAIILPDTPQRSAIVLGGARDAAAALDYNQLFLDPATGATLGRRLNGAFGLDRERLIPFLYRLHYTLATPGRWGEWLLGGIALAWMLDCFVGFYLTLPRGRPFWRKWRPAWKIKRGAGAYRLNFDLHRAFGLWLWLVLFLVALSSMALNLNREVFRPIVAAVLPTSPSLWDDPRPAVPPAFALDWDAAAQKAREEADRRGWDSPLGIIHAARAEGFYMMRFGREHEPGFGASVMYVSGVDGCILSVREAGGGKAGDVVNELMFPIHSGQVAGLPGRILICVAGLVIAILSVTGVYIWWKKRVPRVTRRRRPPELAALSSGEIDAVR